MRSLLVLALGASLWLAPSSALGQVVVATNQGLSFGTILPGTTQTVAVQTAVANRAELVLSGSGKYSVSFSLPPTLTTVGGVAMTLTFGAADGQLSLKNGAAVFDPNLGTTVKLTAGQPTATIRLGGSVTANAAQPAGIYSATIGVIVAP